MYDNALLQQTADHIQTLTNRRRVLLEEVCQVEEELLLAKATHAKLTNMKAPIHQLPHELLTNIFLMCHGAPVQVGSAYRPLEVVTSHVSTHWRRIVLSCPLLWNTIDATFTLRTYTRAQQRLLAYLDRSDQALLDVSLNFTSTVDVPQVLYYLIPHAKRWYRISVTVSAGDAQNIYEPFLSVACPFLIHLSLRIGNPEDTDDPRTEYPDTCPSILTGGSPSLTFLRVAGKVVGNIMPPLRNVQTLHIDAWPRNKMSFVQFRAMLDELPCLVNLSLTGVSIRIPRDPLDTSGPILLRNLKSLRIRGNATPCYRLLSLIALPILESLSLHGVDTFDSAVIPTLKSLTLESCSLSPEELRRISTAFPRTSVLHMDESIPEIHRLLQVEPQSPPIWPHLHTMYVRQLQPADAIPFCLSVGALILGGVPLHTIYLDRRSRGVLRAKDHMRYLHMYLKLLNCDHLAPWPSDLGYEDPDDVWNYQY